MFIKPFRLPHFLLGLWPLALLLLLPSLSAQTGAPPSLPPGTIDGSVHPELIPDSVAFRLFLGALAEASNASVNSSLTARQRAVLRPAHLVDSDVAVFAQQLGTWKKAMSALASPSNNAPSSTLDDIANGTINALNAQMTPQGFGSLYAHVMSEKKGMKIVPVNMSTNTAGGGAK